MTITQHIHCFLEELLNQAQVAKMVLRIISMDPQKKGYFLGVGVKLWRSCRLKNNLLPVISIFISIIKPEEKCVISELCFWISGIPCIYITKHRWDIENNSFCQNSDSKDAFHALYEKKFSRLRSTFRSIITVLNLFDSCSRFSHSYSSLTISIWPSWLIWMNIPIVCTF